jgi:hypothetical protein
MNRRIERITAEIETLYNKVDTKPEIENSKEIGKRIRRLLES